MPDMGKSGWVLFWAFLVAVVAAPAISLADDALDSGAVNMPQRERELVDILMSARRAYQTSHSIAPARDARMDMQIRVISFMRESQVATDWIGTVKSRGITPDGNAWISIEIADGITVSTWQNEHEDGDSATVLRPHSKLFGPVQSAKIASPIIFTGTILESVLAADDEMVMHPQYIARFSALRPAQ
jgi:hypothetical protein